MGIISDPDQTATYANAIFTCFKILEHLQMNYFKCFSEINLYKKCKNELVFVYSAMLGLSVFKFFLEDLLYQFLTKATMLVFPLFRFVFYCGGCLANSF